MHFTHLNLPGPPRLQRPPSEESIEAGTLPRFIEIPKAPTKNPKSEKATSTPPSAAVASENFLDDAHGLLSLPGDSCTEVVFVSSQTSLSKSSGKCLKKHCACQLACLCLASCTFLRQKTRRSVDSSSRAHPHIIRCFLFCLKYRLVRHDIV